MGHRLPTLIAPGLAATLLLGACDDGRDTAPVTTMTTVPAAADLVLRGDGLGAVPLGAAPGIAVAAVTAVLGPPSEDTGWGPAASAYGACPGKQVRAVAWDHLALLFTDGETTFGTGRHLFSWRVDGAPPAVAMATGFGYGATAADADELYPGAVTAVAPDEPFPGFLEIAADGGTVTAYLDDADVVTNLEAGAPCGD